MDAKPPRRTTTPEEEGIELYPGRERFEAVFDKVVKAPPAHRTGKPTGEDQGRSKRGRPRAR
jgi:hypothetical protein